VRPLSAPSGIAAAIRGSFFPTAWLVALVTVVHPAFVFLVTSTVMPECVSRLLALAAVIVVERALRDGRGIGSLQRALLGGALASFRSRAGGMAGRARGPCFAACDTP
jgi:hypothetical protein